MKKEIGHYKYGGHFNYNPFFGNGILNILEVIIDLIPEERKNNKKIIGKVKGHVYKKKNSV
jgi:hypothetical protein